MLDLATQTQKFSQEFTGILLHQLEEAKWQNLENNPLSDEEQTGGGKIFRSLYLSEVCKGLAAKECATMAKDLERDIMKNKSPERVKDLDVTVLQSMNEVVR